MTTQNVARKVKAPKAALCFVQGWRISEALGLAWQDLDFDDGSVLVRRGSTHADRVGMVLGRRSVVTNLFASGSLDLEDVARFVGHNDVATTRGHVQHKGNRPRQVSERALELLDPQRSDEES